MYPRTIDGSLTRDDNLQTPWWSKASDPRYVEAPENGYFAKPKMIIYLRNETDMVFFQSYENTSMLLEKFLEDTEKGNNDEEIDFKEILNPKPFIASLLESRGRDSFKGGSL